MRTGQNAPGFTLRNQHGGDVALADFRGARAVLAFFYPYAFSGICGTELQTIQRSLDDFQNEGVQVLAISCDPLYSVRAFADQEGFGFPLLSDFWPHGAVAKDYGVLDEERGCALRGSFLIGKEGEVRWSVVNQIGDARDFDAHRAAITALR